MFSYEDIIQVRLGGHIREPGRSLDNKGTLKSFGIDVCMEHKLKSLQIGNGKEVDGPQLCEQ